MLRRLFVLIVAPVLAVSASALALPSEKPETIERIRRELVRLPYYGVFDFLAFAYDKGTVTLSGFAYRPVLKKEAVSAVKRVQGVDQVIDKIELLPLSPNDDRIRWATFYSIYNDTFLSRYAPGGGFTSFDRRFEMRRYPGMEPIGMYPIHIVVSGGRTRLLGLVDSAADRTLAAVAAREVPGVFAVDNELVAPPKSGPR